MLDVRVQEGGRYIALMTAERPLVYLDNCAIGRLSGSDSELGRRFLSALSRAGTLALSWMNVVELAGLEEGGVAADIQSFLEGVGTSFCLLDSNPGAVAERTLDADLTEEQAALDREHGNALVRNHVRKSGPATLSGLMSAILAGRDDALEACEEVKAAGQELLEVAARFRLEDGRRLPVAHPHSRVDRTLAGLVNAKVSDPRPPTPNDGADLFHAAVAVGICDFVVLDRHWAHVANQLRDPAPRRIVFSARPQSLLQFVDQFEAAVDAAAAGN